MSAVPLLSFELNVVLEVPLIIGDGEEIVPRSVLLTEKVTDELLIGCPVLKL
jgi:hypothetical protein